MLDGVVASQTDVRSKNTKRELDRLGISRVPPGWKLSTVGNACTIRNELRLPLSQEARATMQGTYPYYGPTGILDYLDEFRAEGDFALIGEDGDHFLDVGRKSQTIRVSDRFNVNNHAHLVADGVACTVDWFFHFFRHKDISHSLTRQGAGRFKLTKQALEKLPILLPPLCEQRKIAEIFRTWDESIETLERLRSAKARHHRALTNLLVFGKRQFSHFCITDAETSHRWFTLPASWDCEPLGKLANEISERNADGGQFEVLSCSKYEGFVRSLEYFKKQVFSADLSGYKKIWRGDFGFPSNHIEEGSIGLQNLTDVGVVSPIYTVFRFAPERVDVEYAFAVLKTGVYRHIFEVSTSASVDRRGSLRWSEFSKLPFPVPSLVEQKAIVEVLRTTRTELDAIAKEVDLFRRQKRGLMQKLLTGEWRVKAAD
nr:restriction endonuclease subunit S [Rhizobium sp. CCGE 510]